MKYKTQDAEEGNNPFLEDIVDLLKLNKEFSYALDTYRDLHECSKLSIYNSRLIQDCEKLKKLVIAINPEHKIPEIEVTLTPTESIDDLKKYEEKYYNMLKEIAKNALEEKEPEVFAYLSSIIVNFKHYFCTVDEDNISRETGSK